MKKITIELARKKLTKEHEEEIVHRFNSTFTIIEDSDNKHENLRFVVVNAEDVKLDTNGITIDLTSVTDPYRYVSVYQKWIYAVHIELWMKN